MLITAISKTGDMATYNPTTKAPARFRALLALLWLPCVLAAQAHYETRAVHDPDGIGKFYMGREIAQVMGPAGIGWLERDEREQEEQTAKAIEAMDIAPGQTVVDLGAGSGYFTFRIAPRVGPRGKVIAVDIEEVMLKSIRERAAREKIANVETVRSTADDPRLKPGSADLVFMVDVYHELEFPREVMQKVRSALRPNGRVILIEYREENPAVRIKAVHKMSEKQIVREMEAIGLTHAKTVGVLPLQHLVVFKNR